MASKGVIDVYLNALPQDIRKPLQQAFYHILDDWRLGDSKRADNARWYAVESTTASVANTEFAIVHGMESAPRYFIPILRLNEVNDQVVPLAVSRAADSKYVYLKSSSTSAVFSGYFEIFVLVAFGLMSYWT